MFWTRYRLLAGLGVFVAVASTAVGDPLAYRTPGAAVTFLGVELVLLASYAALNGVRPRPATIAAAFAHVLSYGAFAAATLARDPSAAVTPVLLAWSPVVLALLPVPAAFALGASSRAPDRGPYVLGAALVGLAGAIGANTLRRWSDVPDAEAGTLVLVTVAVVGCLPVYLAARRRKPGFRDRFPGLDDLPISRPALTVLAWFLFVVSGWGPGRVASGVAFDRAWGVVPPDGLLAVPFVAGMIVLAVLAVGLPSGPDRLEGMFGLAVLGYLAGAVVAVGLPLAAVRVVPPRYLGFASILLVTGLAAAVGYRRWRGRVPTASDQQS